MGRIKELLADLKRRPWVAHLLRMQYRYGNRLGNQFAGAITYFSVLALVPLLMIVFAGLGFFLTVVHPDVLPQAMDQVNERLAGMGPDLQTQIGSVIESFLFNWRAIGIVGLLSALYSSAGWAGNLKSAIRAQTRPEFDQVEDQPNIVLGTVVNLVLLVGLIVLVPVTFAIANASTTLTGWLLGVLNLEGMAGVGVALRVVGLLASVVSGWLLFLYLLTVFPARSFPFRYKAGAAVIGSVGLAVLQYLTSFLVSSFLGNPTAALFGPVIVLMLFLNLFARLILYAAAWMATAIQQANPYELQDIDVPLAEVEYSPVSTEQVEAAQAAVEARGDRKEVKQAPKAENRTLGERLRKASGLPLGGGFDPREHAAVFEPLGGATPTPTVASASSSPPGPAPVAPAEPAVRPEPEPALVRRSTAIRNARASMKTGWVTGALTGVGLGALLAALTGVATRFLPDRREPRP